MSLNLTPVKVDITIETPTVTNNSFYNVCFITENNEAPRTVEINSLADLLTNGYKTTDAVYNFCFYVFLQNGMSKVYVRNKRSDETYEQAFDADDNSNYYYCVIESKDISKILTFNTHLNTVDKYKLQFFSSKECVSDLIQGRKIVFYYDETLPTEKHTLYASRPYPTLMTDAVSLGYFVTSATLQDTVKQTTSTDNIALSYEVAEASLISTTKQLLPTDNITLNYMVTSASLEPAIYKANLSDVSTLTYAVASAVLKRMVAETNSSESYQQSYAVATAYLGA